MENPFGTRRLLLDKATKYLFDDKTVDKLSTLGASDDPPRLTLNAIEKISMSRPRERILGNLDEMYRESFARIQASGDQAQMAALDFAYRREQLYFEILLDVRDAIERGR
jgi:hypothetical protein